ncbi:MAG: TlyA family RNA methyltransferase [Candidatus Limiplasma sp.]|nr:TlyA family RNA methyltransferase [Candidatus Limiplasma sp.]
MGEKLRADVALVRQGLASSREKAQSLIMAGLAYQKEVKILKPSEIVQNPEELHVKQPLHPYVGRGALKLEKALNAFGADVNGAVALDIGAATGGFTDVLLQKGAAHVYAIDVGYGQLDWKIRNDPRVTVMERTNARYLTRESLSHTPTLTVMDVSFISVKLLLPVAAGLMNQTGTFYILIKPQFEAGRQHVGKKGVVRDPAVHEAVIGDIAKAAQGIGYHMTRLDFSPIKGPEGNIEYLAELLPIPVHESKDSGLFPVSQEDIAHVVARAHQSLSKSGIE